MGTSTLQWRRFNSSCDNLGENVHIRTTSNLSLYLAPNPWSGFIAHFYCTYCWICKNVTFRHARYEENPQCAITLFNIVMTI